MEGKVFVDENSILKKSFLYFCTQFSYIVE